MAARLNGWMVGDGLHGCSSDENELSGNAKESKSGYLLSEIVEIMFLLLMVSLLLFLDTIPGPPADVLMPDARSTEVRIQWTAPQKNPALVKEYEVRVEERGSDWKRTVSGCL